LVKASGKSQNTAPRNGECGTSWDVFMRMVPMTAKPAISG